MTPRPRKKGNLDLPLNLYAQTKRGVTYYQYKDPRNGKYHGLGTDKKQAIIDANQLNSALYAEAGKRRVNAIVEQNGSILFSAWLDRYREIIIERKLKPNTLAVRKNILFRIEQTLGALPIREITVKHCAELIGRYVKEDKNRMAQSIRSVLIDVFKEAIADGEADNSPAEKTRNPVAIVQRSRLTLDAFQSILTAAEQNLDPWVANSMLLALVTGQAREDIALALKKKPRNWESLYKQYLQDKAAKKNPTIPPSYVDDGYYYATRRKTGALVKIPLSLRLDAVGLSVGDVINRCNDNIFTQYLLHHSKRRTTANVGDAIHKDRLSKRFASARELAGLTWPAEPPTFHEIRSLSERLYKKQGINTKDLLGHREEKTTAIYNNARGAEWIEVK